MDYISSCKEFGIELHTAQIAKFEDYYRLLVDWNEKMNLTAITRKDEVYLKHFLDSVSVVRLLEDLNDRTLLDVGTGAGFPGIPLKILFPKAKITLMDSLSKRLKFLDTVIAELKLNEEGSIQTIHDRAEDLAHKPSFREQYDYVVSRAVANLSTLSEYCLPFVRVGGSFISYKSEKAKEELEAAGKAIHLLGGDLIREDSFLLPGSDLSRTLIEIGKKEHTLEKYPRKAPLPSKMPL